MGTAVSALDDDRVKHLDWYYTVLSGRLGMVWVYPLGDDMWAAYSSGWREPGDVSLGDAIGGSASFSAEDTIAWALR